MLRYTLTGLSLALLVVGLACQGGRHETAPTTNSDGPGPHPPEASGAADQPSEAREPAPPTPTVEEEAFTGYAENAFPPVLPSDDAHVNAWQRDDCMLCHESGLSGAPVVKHVGMSRELLSAKCRTCHVALPAGTPAADAGAVLPLPKGGPQATEGTENFAKNAFPPTMPFDEAHQGAWLRDDCLVCHEVGIGTAPAIVHEGMAKDLLTARCRSCHLPSVRSGEADFGNPHRD